MICFVAVAAVAAVAVLLLLFSCFVVVIATGAAIVIAGAGPSTQKPVSPPQQSDRAWSQQVACRKAHLTAGTGACGIADSWLGLRWAMSRRPA